MKRKLRLAKSSSGFSLVEMSIAMIIAGVMIGLSMKGYELVKQANLLASVEQINQYRIAIKMYTDTYGNAPGVTNGHFDSKSFCDDLANAKLIPANSESRLPIKVGSLSVEYNDESLQLVLNGISPMQAKYIDKAIDDGKPNTGDVVLKSGACAAGEEYDLKKSDPVCSITINT